MPIQRFHKILDESLVKNSLKIYELKENVKK